MNQIRWINLSVANFGKNQKSVGVISTFFATETTTGFQVLLRVFFQHQQKSVTSKSINQPPKNGMAAFSKVGDLR